MKTENLKQKVQKSSFESDIPHKFEWLRTVDGIDFINDAKSSDFESTLYALEQISGKIIWITAVPEYAYDYEPIQEWLSQEGVAIFVLGNASQNMKQELQPHTDFFMEKPTLVEVLSEVQKYTEREDQATVLFSPSCPTFDLYEGYRERGDHYKSLIENL